MWVQVIGLNRSTNHTQVAPTNQLHLLKYIGNSHSIENRPVLVRSPKWSSIALSQYLDGRPLGNTECRCQIFAFEKWELQSIFLHAVYGWIIPGEAMRFRPHRGMIQPHPTSIRHHRQGIIAKCSGYDCDMTPNTSAALTTEPGVELFVACLSKHRNCPWWVSFMNQNIQLSNQRQLQGCWINGMHGVDIWAECFACVWFLVIWWVVHTY